MLCPMCGTLATEIERTDHGDVAQCLRPGCGHTWSPRGIIGGLCRVRRFLPADCQRDVDAILDGACIGILTGASK